MEIIRFNTACIGCIYNKFMKSVPDSADEKTKLRYARGILRIIANASNETSAPEIVAECTKFKNDTFGTADDFTDMKAYFNRLITGLEPDISSEISKSRDPLRLAICYSLLGNYIDFGAMDRVDEDKLRELILNAENMDISPVELENLRADLEKCKRLVYLTDNCGEIVFDKLLIKEIIRQYPRLDITVLVRGENVLNDATIQDAEQIGLTELTRVIGNGTPIAGTCIERLPEEIRSTVLSADIIISKGQGNFETLCYSKMNIYYLFMCKCKMFADRFNAPELCPMLLNDLRIKKHIS